MKFNNTDHARNLIDRNAIVYYDAFGQIVRLTRDDFANEEEFVHWKTISDEFYHEIEKGDHPFRQRTISIYAFTARTPITPAPEDLMMEYIAEQERKELYNLLMQGYKECLTEIQQRRLWMYCIQGLDEYEIAGIEGVKQQVVSASIRSAKNKIKKFFEKQGVKTRKSRQ